jgi:hypothetical protein
MITKASGEHEPFAVDKLRRSLIRVGANQRHIDAIIEKVDKLKPKTTRQLHRMVIAILEQESQPIAARYNLKQALMQLGPAGFPFEKFVAFIFNHLGYKTRVDIELNGFCVNHEIDILLTKKTIHELVECKFHNRQGLTCDVKIPLYLKARFDDIMQATSNPLLQFAIADLWIVTNTRFTSQAIQYAQCKKINLMDWSYPEGRSLAQLINEFKLHPITALTNLSGYQKRTLIHEGFVLCNDAYMYKDVIDKLRLSPDQKEKFIKECKAVCEY